VLLDLTLGAEDGLALFALSQAPRPVVVALTGHDDPETRERCLAAGCLDVLVKPIRSRELKSQIAAWLGVRTPA
jgi:DNA-binding response OmpR family regulator